MFASTLEEAIPTGDYICVVGAGPVGIALALDLARRKQNVLLLDAGSAEPNADISGAFDTEIVKRAPHAKAADSSRQGLGGTSSAWGARCSPYDPIDFDRRDYVSESGMPVSYNEASTYHASAAAFFGIQADFTDCPYSNDIIDTNHVIRVSPRADAGRHYANALSREARISVALNTQALRIVLDSNAPRLSGLEVVHNEMAMQLSPSEVVLCCGGVQNARLLLLLEREFPAYFKTSKTGIGRYYMGHLTGTIARISYKNPKMAKPFLFVGADDGSFQRHCYTLSPGSQRNNGLLNTYFVPVSYPLGDPQYRSGTLSALHLGLSLRYMSTNYMRKFRPGHVSTPYDHKLQFLRHLANVARNPLATCRGLATITSERLGYQQRLPLFQYENPAGIYALRYHSEHAPKCNSRVTLSEKSDRNNIPLPRIDFKYGEEDFASVEKAHHIFADWLEKTGTGSLQWLQPEEKRLDHIRVQALDGYHQIGLTRMSEAPGTGAVDRNCQVHGIQGLFAAGASVLPVSSHAHPTFTAVAFALRLAEHLAPMGLI